MASKASSINAESSLRCSVCLDDFKDPKVLPCCHTFCKKCLDKIQSRGNTNLGKGENSEPGEPLASYPGRGRGRGWGKKRPCDTTHNEELSDCHNPDLPPVLNSA